MSRIYLDELVAAARTRVSEAREREPLEALKERARQRPAPSAFRSVLSADGVSLIAEIKRASPSKGDLAPHLNAPDQARVYRDAGAAAVSVLTEPRWFKGGLDDLVDVAALGVPALRKDFVIDAYQVWEARAAGAAAVLLIVAALDEPELAALHDEIQAAGMDALVEVHDEAELAAARRIDAEIIGVNVRDLRTFEIDRDAFVRLRQEMPDTAVVVAESGVRGPEDVRRAGLEGAHAVLVGESLVTAADPWAATAALVEAGRPENLEPA